MGAAPGAAEQELLLRAKDGGLDAFNALVERYQAQVFTLCYRLLGDREAAEDAAQETFLAAYRAIGSFSGENFRAWLMRIAANESKDELRRRQRRPASSLNLADEETGLEHEPPDPGETPEAHLARMELGAQLQRALDELPFDQRQAIVLLDVMGYHYEEIATMTRTSLGTVKSRISRGRERLRKALGPQGEPSAPPGRQEDR